MPSPNIPAQLLLLLQLPLQLQLPLRFSCSSRAVLLPFSFCSYRSASSYDVAMDSHPGTSPPVRGANG
jgi:hypothetical protein